VGPVQGGILLYKWLVASLVGGGLVLGSVYAILEREVEVWQGLVGILVGVTLTVIAVSLAMSPWYFSVLALIVLIGVIAHALRVMDTRIRERLMVEEDEQRFREAIEFDEKNAAAHAFLGRLYHREGRLQEALGELQRAAALDPNDARARSDLKALVEEMEARPAPPGCPRCESPLDASGKTCPQCGWSRSTVKGLRDIYAAGVLKRAVLYALLVSTGIGILGAILRIALAFTLTLLLVGWVVGVVLLFRWFLRQEM